MRRRMRLLLGRFRRRTRLRVAAALSLAAALLIGLLLQSDELARERERLAYYLVTNSWYVFQLDLELQRFLREANAAELGLADPDALRLRFDILWSRIGVLEHADLADRPEVANLLGRLEAAMAALDPQVQSLEPADQLALAELRRGVGAFEDEVHGVAVEYFGGVGYRHVTAAIESQSTRTALLKGAMLLLIVAITGYLLVEIRVSWRAALREAEARRKAESARRRIKQANAARDLFIRNVSHELRTPLNGLVGAATVLKSTSLDPVQREIVAMLSDSSGALASIVNDIIEASRLTSRKVTLRPQEIDLRKLLEEAVDLFRPAALRKDLALELKIDPDLPERARGDRFRLRQILTNLIGNAVKFDPTGPVAVSASARREGLRVRLRIEVADHGPGVPEADRERIFEMFAQGDAVDAAQPEGVGVGLAICKTLCAAMDGDIVCAPSATGARFVVTARLDAAEPAPPLSAAWAAT